MRTLLQPVMGLICLSVMAVSCKKHNDPPPIPADVQNAVETQPAVQKPVTVSITANLQGYYEALPYYYSYTTKSYPTIIFIPGGGQYGNGASDLPSLLNDGIAKYINAKSFPAAFSVDGVTYSFIVLTPQFKTYPSVADVETFINYAKSKYRIDSSRLYMSGISIGGEVIGDVTATYPNQVTAIVPISGESRVQANCTLLAQNKIPIWDFHNSGDPTINISESTNFITWVNAANPAIPPKQTIFQSSEHDAWSTALAPTYSESGLNVYEWMLQYAK